MATKKWIIPTWDTCYKRRELSIIADSLLTAVLSVLRNHSYTNPALYGMEFTDQERAVILHSKRVKDMRVESLNLFTKTMNHPNWARTPEQRRRDYLKRQIAYGEISKHWYDKDFRCGGCETIIPAKQSHLWSLGGHFCNYHCFGNKLIKDRAESNGD